ncbi:MAG: hypothetical protein ACPGAN_00675 [Candidatus Poseidoniaceae archaeon]
MTGEQSDDTGQTSLDKFLSKFTSKDDKIIPIQKIENHTDLPIETIDMPSKKVAPIESTNTKGQKFHKLDTSYPNPPVPSRDGGMVLHNSHLHDLSGISTLFDWISDGDAAIVELGSMISRQSEFDAAIAQLTRFVIEDVGGKILQIGESRILLLPSGCTGISGLEDESFNTDNQFKMM